MERWLVGLDIDGTIVHEDDSMSERVGDAVRAVVEAGHVVVLATGRSQSTTESTAARLGALKAKWTSGDGSPSRMKKSSPASSPKPLVRPSTFWA